MNYTEGTFAEATRQPSAISAPTASSKASEPASLPAAAKESTGPSKTAESSPFLDWSPTEGHDYQSKGRD